MVTPLMPKCGSSALAIWTTVEQHILGELAGVEQPVILVANKADQVPPDEQGAFLQEVAGKRDFASILGVSALERTGLPELVQAIVERLDEGPQYYPEDWITDHPERFIVAEFIREELLLRPEEEIPPSIAVDVDEIKRIREEPDAHQGDHLRGVR